MPLEELIKVHGFGAFPGGRTHLPKQEKVRDSGSISGWGGFPGGRHGNSLQFSCLENTTDRVAWWATIHGVTKGT